MTCHILVALIALLVFVPPVSAQEPRASIGGAILVVTQPHEGDQLGGTTLAGSALVSAHVSPRLAIEFEPAFDGSYSGDYTYRPSPSLIATVATSRREMFFPVQARLRAGMLEPVIGVGVLRSAIRRHATIGEQPYFDDGRADYSLAFVGGLDLALELAPNFHLVPTFRVRIGPEGSDSLDDPLGAQTRSGPFNLRYGIGARLSF